LLPRPAIQASTGCGEATELPKAGACCGKSTIAKARLRSANASAAESTLKSLIPGTSSRLKISRLSSALLGSKTGTTGGEGFRKSAELKQVLNTCDGCGPCGRLMLGDNCCGAMLVPYPPVLGVTVTSCDTPLRTWSGRREAGATSCRLR
jgi:hypothetical protein